MEKINKKEILENFEESLRQINFRIDAELARTFLRQNHPECESALVAALEQARLPIRQTFLKKVEEAIDLNWRRISEWQVQFDEITEGFIQLIGEYGESVADKLNSTFTQINALGKLNLSEEEETARSKAILEKSDDGHSKTILQFDERRITLQRKLEEVMLLPARAQEEFSIIIDALPEAYVAECEEKSKPIYQEFLT